MVAGEKTKPNDQASTAVVTSRQALACLSKVWSKKNSHAKHADGICMM